MMNFWTLFMNMPHFSYPLAAINQNENIVHNGHLIEYTYTHTQSIYLSIYTFFIWTILCSEYYTYYAYKGANYVHIFAKDFQNLNIGPKQNLSYGPPNLQSISRYINSCPVRVKEWGTCCHSY